MPGTKGRLCAGGGFAGMSGGASGLVGSSGGVYLVSVLALLHAVQRWAVVPSCVVVLLVQRLIEVLQQVADIAWSVRHQVVPAQGSVLKHRVAKSSPQLQTHRE